jgi:hypothetical protein
LTLYLPDGEYVEDEEVDEAYLDMVAGLYKKGLP